MSVCLLLGKKITSKAKKKKKHPKDKKTEAKRKKPIDHPHILPAVETGGEAAAESCKSNNKYYRLHGE